MKQNAVVILVIFMVFACDTIIEVTDISGKMVNVLAPTDQSIVMNADVTFTWDAVEDVESYKIQIAIPDFENAQQIVTDSLVSQTSFEKTLDSGAYEWRIRAENSDYATPYTSQKFKVELASIDISNGTIVLVFPDDSATFSTTDTINFSWESLQGAESYTIQIAYPDFNNPTEILVDENTTETAYEISNLNANSYQWRVKASNSEKETTYSNQSFTVN